MIPVFYNPKMVADVASFSPSARKPAAVIEDWRQHFANDINVVASTACSRDDLKLAHNPAFVDGVLDCFLPNGFQERSAAVAASLPYTTGSMLAAAKQVMTDRRTPIACSPTSGFHHAGFDMAGGYCTFNGLVVTAMKLKAMHYVDQVLILDMDQHYGDGTDELIEELKLDYISHITATKGYARSAETIDRLPDLLKRWLAPLTEDATRSIVLYQAGADAHVDDPLGGWLTTEQMRERDSWVFRMCRTMELPTVWNLAGGYQRDKRNTIEPVLAIHRNTMSACVDAMKEFP